MAEIESAISRRLMVERQLRGRGIKDERVLAAMGSIPREEFVPERYRRWAYIDEPISIGFGQTVSQPYMAALMAQCLELQGHETVLEVGAGCGYAAAVLGALAAQIIAVEIIPELASMAEANLRRTGCDGNVQVVCFDGSRGWPECAPYDAISVAAATRQVPPALLEQLTNGGRLAIPIGEDDHELRVAHKTSGEIRWRVAALCRFVPLRETEPVA